MVNSEKEYFKNLVAIANADGLLNQKKSRITGGLQESWDLPADLRQ